MSRNEELDAWLMEHLFDVPAAVVAGQALGPHNYTDSGDGMLRVIDALTNRMPYKDLHIEHYADGLWHVSTCRDEDANWHGWSGSESLPMAVALAAKAAVEAAAVETKEQQP